MTVIGAGLIAVFLAIAGLHLYWGVGGVWPGEDANELRLRVVGTHRGPMPGFLACAMVAAALAGAAAVVMARHSPIMGSGFAWIVLAGYAVLILVFGCAALQRMSAPYSTMRAARHSST